MKERRRGKRRMVWRIPLLFFVSAFLASAACSPGVRQREPAAAEAVRAEPAKKAGATAGVKGIPLGVDALSQIYSCWFANPYEFMFDPSKSPKGGAVVGGKSFGMFMGGIGGILHYGSLTECFAAYAGVKKASYSDLEPAEKISGLSLYGPRMDGSKPFGFFNAELVRWGYTYLIPQATDRLGETAAQEIYDGVFSRFFRLMAESYLTLVDSGKYKDEMTVYWNAVTGEGGGVPQDGMTFIQSRFDGKLPQYGAPWDGTSWTPQMSFGFWLRRGFDGTDGELWTGLKILLKRFDATWYASLAQTYRSPDITW
jgi:hypothetical protein